MKIVFKIIKSQTGSDSYYQRLAAALSRRGLETEIIYFPHFFQYCPLLIKLFDHSSAADIVHSDIEYGWIFKNRFQPLVLTSHHSVFDPQYQRYTSFPQKIFHYFFVWPNMYLSYKLADKIIAVSRFTAKSLTKTFGRRSIIVIHNSVNIASFCPAKNFSHNSKFTLLAVGNPSVRKGSDLLPRIMSLLGPDFQLNYTTGLRNDPFHYQRVANMTSLGRLSHDQLVYQYQHCDALLFPTRLEGFGYAAAEAMSCGRPVVTTNYSSLPEIVINGRTGFLCRPNSVTDFVKKIKYLYHHPLDAQKMGQAARKQIVTHFSLRSWAHHYQTVYESL